MPVSSIIRKVNNGKGMALLTETEMKNRNSEHNWFSLYLNKLFLK
jgi:hypothetical protein